MTASTATQREAERAADDAGTCSQLYRDDPDRADRLLFGRVSHPDRRGFLKHAGLAAMGALVGGAIPSSTAPCPRTCCLVALAGESVIEGKDGLVVLNEQPLSAETPPHLLDDAVTPTARHFVRNNGIPPAGMDPAGWRLTLDGLVEHPLSLGIDDLRRRFEVVTARLTLECAGNGRAFFDPPATARSGPTAPSPAPSGPESASPTC